LGNRGDRGGLAAIAKKLFFEIARLFLRVRGSDLRHFLKISILFEDISREIKAFFN
jgi:hypothetical protein